MGYALFFGAAGHLFVNLQTNLPEVREAAYRYLPWLTALPIVAVWSYLLDGLFIGATRAREMRDGMVVSVAFFALIVWLTRGLGNEGLWLAFLAFMAMRGLSLAWLGLRIRQRRVWIA